MTRQISKTVKFPPYPPVILVGTHADKCASISQAEAICRSILSQFRSIGQILDCVPLAKDGSLTQLENAILKVRIHCFSSSHFLLGYNYKANDSSRKSIHNLITSSQPFFKVPGTWIKLATQLNWLRGNVTRKITFSDFAEVCRKAGVKESEYKQVCMQCVLL